LDKKEVIRKKRRKMISLRIIMKMNMRKSKRRRRKKKMLVSMQIQEIFDRHGTIILIFLISVSVGLM